jgi:hypothetical protein
MLARSFETVIVDMKLLKVLGGGEDAVKILEADPRQENEA